MKKIKEPLKEIKEKVKCAICEKEFDKKTLKEHMTIHPTPIVDYLYLGSYFNATNKNELKNMNIKYILNCASECKNLYSDNFTYLHLPIKDTTDFEIDKYFDQGIEFIKNIINQNNKQDIDPNLKGNILVHCQLGKSGSASIVMAYLIKEKNMTVNESFLFIKNKRRTILPNMGFMLKLRDLESNITH